MAVADRENFFVLGAGKSGRASARLLTQRGYEVAWFDDAPGEVSRALEANWVGDRTHVSAVDATGASDALHASDCLVVSPGVPLSHPIVSQARAASIEITGELEVAYTFMSEMLVVGVTGTNGKSTVVNILGGVLQQAGRKATVAGNIGVPFCDVVADGEVLDAVVLEISSFQLDTIDRFRADVAVLLNVTDDHLDRYNDSFDEYAASKARILNRADERTIFVYNVEDATCRSIAGTFAGRKIAFSASRILDDGVYVADGMIVCRRQEQKTEIIPVDEFPPVGLHNLENALAAVGVATALEIDSEAIRRALAAYQPLPHRMEVAGVIDGITFINDSKATNVDATIKSVQSVDGPILLILGGVDKNSDYTQLRPHLERIKHVILIGESRDKIRAALAGQVDLREAESMEEAVGLGFTLGVSGDTVLLAPACASFDMFLNYAERGRAFQAAVAALQESE